MSRRGRRRGPGRKRFGDHGRARPGLSFSVRAGELFGFVGPDGGGKTTLFRILTTLLVPDTGTRARARRDVVTESGTLRRRIGYMPGRFSLYPDLSVAENLRFFASVFGTTAGSASTIAHRADLRQLEPFTDRRAGGALRRHEAEARALLRAGAPAGDPVSRRADDRRRCRVAARVLGSAGDAIEARRADRWSCPRRTWTRPTAAIASR